MLHENNLILNRKEKQNKPNYVQIKVCKVLKHYNINNVIVIPEGEGVGMVCNIYKEMSRLYIVIQVSSTGIAGMQNVNKRSNRQ